MIRCCWQRQRASFGAGEGRGCVCGRNRAPSRLLDRREQAELIEFQGHWRFAIGKGVVGRDVVVQEGVIFQHGVDQSDTFSQFVTLVWQGVDDRSFIS